MAGTNNAGGVLLDDMTVKDLAESAHTDMDKAQAADCMKHFKDAVAEYEKLAAKGKEDNQMMLISKFSKTRLDAAYGPNWHVVVGASYVMACTGESKSYFHWYYRKLFVTAVRL